MTLMIIVMTTCIKETLKMSISCKIIYQRYSQGEICVLMR